MVDIELKDYTDFYFSIFLPGFAKYTGYLLKKDESVLTSIEAAHSHLMQYFDLKGDDERLQNLMKAKNHLERATLDCYKLLWAYLDTELEALMGDRDRRLVGVTMKDVELLTVYRNTKKESLEARKEELANIGVNVNASIQRYCNLIASCEKIMENIDPDALHEYDTRKIREKRKRRYVEPLIALLIGIIGTAIFQYLIQPLF